MNKLIWWLRAVGALYILNGIMMALVRAPIRAAGPNGTLDAAAAGEPTAKFLVDTWIGFGLEVGVIGVVLLIASAVPHLARGLVWLVIGIELTRGIVYDSYMLARDYDPAVYVPWLVVHGVVIATGIFCLRGLPRAEAEMSNSS